MAITSLLNSNPNPSLFSKRRQNFHDNGNLCWIRSANFVSCSKISAIKVTNFMYSVSSKNNTNRVISTTSKRKPLKKVAVTASFETPKWLKTAAVVILQSMMMAGMMMHFPNLSWARHQFVEIKEHNAESFELTGQHEHDYVSRLRGKVMEFLAIVFAFVGLLIQKWADAICRPGLKPVVVKLQVCFVVGERDLKRHVKELERISKMSILDSLSHEECLQRRVDQAMKFGVASKDLADKLEATTNFLLGLSYSSISSYASVEVKKSIKDADDCSKQLLLEEGRKFDDDGTLDYFEETHLVVTLLVTAKVDGLSRLPPIYDAPDLRWTLNRLQNITKDDKIHAVEVLWAPKDERHIMSPKKYQSAYPLLKPLRKRF